MTLAIDIGSNTIKCLLGRPLGSLVDVVYEKTIDGRICSPNGGLVENASRIISDAIDLFVSEARVFCSSFKIVAVATSALRDSCIGARIAADVRTATSVNIRILTGDEEARLSYFGAVHDVGESGEIVFFDLGGGSMELVLGNGVDIRKSFSMPIGSIRMTSKHFPDGIVSPDRSLAMSEEVSKVLRNTISPPPDCNKLVGVGGGVAAARFLKRRLGFAGRENEISLSEMETMFTTLAFLVPLDRHRKFGIPMARADIVPAAFLTILGLMKFLNSATLLHTFYNIRYAIVLGGM